jgi:hypothetical protein
MSLYDPCNWSGMVQKKAFHTADKNKWSRRWLVFKAEEFSLAWSDGPADRENPRRKFVMRPEDVTYLPVDEHRKSFEVKVSSGGQSLYFCPESADAQNQFLTHVDAARRLKVAAVEQRGAVFRTESHVVSLSAPSREAHPKLFSWGVGALLGSNKDHVDGVSVPQQVHHFRARCVGGAGRASVSGARTRAPLRPPSPPPSSFPFRSGALRLPSPPPPAFLSLFSHTATRAPPLPLQPPRGGGVVRPRALRGDFF